MSCTRWQPPSPDCPQAASPAQSAGYCTAGPCGAPWETAPTPRHGAQRQRCKSSCSPTLPGAPPESQRMRIYSTKCSPALPSTRPWWVGNQAQWAEPDWFCKKHGGTKWLRMTRMVRNPRGCSCALPEKGGYRLLLLGARRWASHRCFPKTDTDSIYTVT